MAEITTIARPYAEAVFKLAVEQCALTRWSTVLDELAQVAGNSVMREALSNPNVPVATLTELFTASIKSPLTEADSNFLQLVLNNGRADVLPAIREQFEALRSDHEGVADAFIATAFPISDEELAKLTTALEARFKRRIKASVSIDKDLIGGVRVTVGDEVLDASVRGRLQTMTAALTA